MLRADVIYLIGENPEAHGVFETPEKTEQMVYCTVRSVSSADFWRAYENGHEPAVVFDLTDYADYQGEKNLMWGGKMYRVIRTYIDGQSIELTCEEAVAYDLNANDP